MCVWAMCVCLQIGFRRSLKRKQGCLVFYLILWVMDHISVEICVNISLCVTAFLEVQKVLGSFCGVEVEQCRLWGQKAVDG